MEARAKEKERKKETRHQEEEHKREAREARLEPALSWDLLVPRACIVLGLISKLTSLPFILTSAVYSHFVLHVGRLYFFLQLPGNA